MANNKDNKHLNDEVIPAVEEDEDGETIDEVIEVEDVEENTDDTPTDDNGEAKE